MRKKFIMGMPAVIPALIVMATFELLLPAPALAQEACARRMHTYCNAAWQDFYTSREECLNIEIANHCNGAATSTGDDLAPAVRED